MHARIGPATLQQDVVTVLLPRFGKRGPDDGPAVPSSLMGRVRHDVFNETVPAASPQEIGNRDEHAGCDDPMIRIRHEDGQPVAPDSFLPNALGHFLWFGMIADIRCLKERK